jgi:hypothetical protein
MPDIVHGLSVTRSYQLEVQNERKRKSMCRITVATNRSRNEFGVYRLFF